MPANGAVPVREDHRVPGGSGCTSRVPDGNAFTSDANTVASPSRPRYSGLMPIGSRPSTSSSPRWTAKANMPRSRDAAVASDPAPVAASPADGAASRCSTTSLSEAVRQTVPASSSRRSCGAL